MADAYNGTSEVANAPGFARVPSRRQTFLDTVAKDFAEHGAEAIEQLRKDDVATYLKLISWLVPRELILQREQEPTVDYADLSLEELTELVEAERLGGLEIEHQRVLGRRLHRQVGRLLALEDAVDVAGRDASEPQSISRVIIRLV